MATDEHPDPVILDAVREKLVRLDSDLAAREQEVERALAAYQNAQSLRDQVRASRDKLTAYLEEHSAKAPDSVLDGATVTIRPWTFAGGTGKSLAPRALKHEIISAAKAALADGARMRAEEIYQYLVVAGVPVNFENGPRRVTQILSESGMFDPDRVRGWGLKVEAPAQAKEVSSGL